MHSPTPTRFADLGRPYDVLLDELLSRWGDDCRFVVRYDADSVALVHLRDDLLDKDLLPRIDEVVDRARARDEMDESHSQRGYGDLETSAEIREDAVVVHFHGRGDEGLIATVDRVPASDEPLLGK